MTSHGDAVSRHWSSGMVGSWAAASPANGVERLGRDVGSARRPPPAARRPPPAARRPPPAARLTDPGSRLTDPERHRSVQSRRRADTGHEVRDRVDGGGPAGTGSAGPPLDVEDRSAGCPARPLT
ncbi:hypothetical protein [Streptomyces canus]|uniref:hypothetical protein n=1 Tax=Streptomyces canus TaxID=58343 RepID=UPI0022564C8A|nr:hypothetical protein [Streptomyces canus]MCX4861244.1 hypothetical protein [Streptomyces canus]